MFHKTNFQFLINLTFAIIEGILSLVIFYIAYKIFLIVRANRKKHNLVNNNNDIYMVIMIVTLALASASVSIFYSYNTGFWLD
jgi:hypothetical protein